MMTVLMNKVLFWHLHLLVFDSVGVPHERVWFLLEKVVTLWRVSRVEGQTKTKAKMTTDRIVHTVSAAAKA